MPPVQDPPATVTLKVKVPVGYLEVGDEFILGTEVPVHATLAAVRNRIQATIPSHPSPTQQRILYGGRALVDNDQTLADALNIRRDPTQTTYVIHLVVKGVDTQHSQRGRSSVATTEGDSESQRVGQSDALPPAQGIQSSAGITPQPPPQPPQGLPQPPTFPQGRASPFNPVTAALHQHHALHNQVQGGAILPPPFDMPMGMHGPTFGQAVQQGQQQRAAAGRTGITPTGQTQTQSETQGDDSTTNEAHVRDTNPNLNTQQGNPAFPSRHPVSNQGFHLQGTGPNGQHFTINHQSFAIPAMGQQLGGAPIPFNRQAAGIPGMANGIPFPPAAFQFPNVGAQTPRREGPSALDQARENVAEMRRLLDQMRSDSAITEERQRQIRIMQERTQRLEDYIDPFHLGRVPGGSNTDSQAAMSVPRNLANGLDNSQQPSTEIAGSNSRSTSMPPPFRFPPGPQIRSGMNGFRLPPPPTLNRPLLSPLQQQSADSAHEVTCYLLSSPNGPQAILFSPEHGRYVSVPGSQGSFSTAIQPQSALPTYRFAHPPANNLLRPNALPGMMQPDTQAQPGAVASGAQILGNENGAGVPPAALAGGNNHAQNAAIQEAQQGAQQPQQQQQQQQQQPGDLNAVLQPLLNHFWLLIRILIFAYFLLGANMGWRRPIALLLIGGGFMLVRAGLFGNGGLVRRWWEGVVGVDEPRHQAVAGQDQRIRQVQPVAQLQGAVPAGAPRNTPGATSQTAPARMPTPEEVAERLIREQREHELANRGWWREQIRPLERVIALLIASLWPGVGEAHVRARRDAERRRRDEEEVERRRIEEENRRREEQEMNNNKSPSGEEGQELDTRSSLGKDIHDGAEPVATAHASGVESQEGQLRRRSSVTTG